MFMIHLHTNFHMPRFNASLITAIQLKKQKKILHSDEVVNYHSNNLLSTQVSHIYSKHSVTLLW